ncbi:hypothetical protein CI109_100096 [Kwoniella shandongensis]|uniref:Uncharacterized protein n=1 Tax=Kwoniella shandongensis TaxID=1734106 RepID=A0A5M6BQP1_9TREE|nr:uncharacterized protein CI109_007247 [Kwoniella shandongensis]KAA5524412.1 hypothetical protein CI109_007247 [Kwoniella shandongensis]
MPSILRTKYLQYKRDNNQLSSWLCRTAVQYGYPLDSFKPSDISLEDEDEQKTAQQLRNAKKKAKAKAKAKGQGHDETTTTSVSGDYLLTIPQYTQITSYLIEKKVAIPVEFMKLLRRCITLREKCLRPFFARSKSDESIAGHQYFIDILREAEGMLLAYRGAKVGGDSATETSKAVEGVANGANRYAHLATQQEDVNDEEEEDLPDIFLPEPPRPVDTSISTTRMRFATVSSIEEGMTTLLVFFEDVHSVRQYIIDLWTDFKNGKTDLMTAAVVTNTAMELLRRSHDDLVSRVIEPTFKGDLGLVSMCLVNLMARCSPVMLQPPLFTTLGPNDDLLKRTYDYLLLPNFQILGGLADLINDEMIPIYKPGHYGEFDTTLDSAKLPFDRRWKQCQILLCESLTEYQLLLMAGDLTKDGLPSSARATDNIYFLDEMAYEMDRFAKTKQCSLLLLVYSQVFLDVVMTSGIAAKRGLATLQKSAGVMVDSLKRRSTVEGPTQPGSWPARSEAIAREVMKEAEVWHSTDPIAIMRKIVNRNGRRMGITADYKSTLMERNPMLCGLLLFRLQLQYQRIGFALAEAWGTILYTAHLVAACGHNAAQFSQFRLPKWKDMDLIIDMHGEADIFGGKVPKTIDDSYISFLQMMGYSSEVLASMRHAYTDTQLPEHLLRRRRQTPVNLESKNGPKGLKDHTQIIPIFTEKYLGNPKVGTKVDINVIEALLTDLGSSRHPTGKSVGPARRKRNHRSPKFSIVQLLSILEQGLMSETTSLRFDYISMHLRCIRLLREVKAHNHDYFLGKLGPGYIEGDHQLSWIVGWILHWATMSGRAAEYIGIKREKLGRQGGMVGSKVLAGATEAIKKFLNETQEGEVEVRKIEVA